MTGANLRVPWDQRQQGAVRLSRNPPAPVPRWPPRWPATRLYPPEGIFRRPPTHSPGLTCPTCARSSKPASLASTPSYASSAAAGMATVFLATDLKHDRPVAFKVLHPDLAQSLGPERFQREIRLAARLQHPHILTVHDSGATAGHLWFTMPFVEGESLRDRLKRERQLPLDDALRIAPAGGAGAALRPRARRGPPRHQAREPAAHQRRQHPRRRLRHRPRARRGRRRPAHPDRHERRDAGLHEPRAGQRATARSTPGPTSTAWAPCCSRCWRASSRTPVRRCRRS